MDYILTEEEVRVLGALIEKEVTTPDYYPLSLNALKNACNQTSNRDPIVSYDEATVSISLDKLKEKGFVDQDNLSRVPKFSEMFLKKSRFMAPETAIICELMLRGPQTIGEIRTHSERMHPSENLEATLGTLKTLEEWGYVTLLPRQAGKKEPRYTHLLCGTPVIKDLNDEEKTSAPSTSIYDRFIDREDFGKLQTKVDTLQVELADLKKSFLDFKTQF
ncbi:MAG: YceH family protein [Nitrospirota bacterium]|mgnify:CR=1 FL=1